MDVEKLDRWIFKVVILVTLKKIIHCSHFPVNFSLVTARLTGSLCHVIKTNRVIARHCETYVPSDVHKELSSLYTDEKLKPKIQI